MRVAPRLILALAFFAAGCATVENPTVLPLKPYVGRLVTLEAKLGGETLSLLFDSGAGVTALTPKAARKAGCEPFGRNIGFRMSGARIDFQRCGAMTLNFGDFASKKETFVFDLGAVLPKDLPSVSGVVSLASFAERPLTLDLAAGTITLETRQSLRQLMKEASKGEMRLIVGPGGDEMTVLTKVDAGREGLWFLLDSANLDAVLIPASSAEILGFSPAEPRAEGELALTLAHAPKTSVKARIADIIYDGALNEETLRRYKVTLDLESRRVWYRENRP
jgi:hypothetical protein